MNPTVITIAQRKGGMCKSTTALNLACVFAEYGLKVLVLDLDDQRNTSKSISRIVESEKTIEDLLLNEKTTVEDVAVKTGWNNVSIIPSSSNLSGVVKYLDQELGSHLVLKEKLSKCSEYDFVILDTSPSLNILVINALCASNYMFIPLASKYFSLSGLQQTLESFNKVINRLNPELKLLGIGIMNHDCRNVLANEVIEEIKEKYEEDLFNTIIGINIKIEEAQVKKQSILSYAPEDRGSKQYRELGREILAKIKEKEEVKS